MFLKDKKFLIIGIASKLSIAAGIAKAMAAQGAQLAYTYQNDKLKSRVEGIATECGSNLEMCFPLDVASDEQIDDVFKNIKQKWGYLDGVIHAVGFAPGDQLNGEYDAVTTREGFRIAHDISVYSFTAIARAAKELMKDRNGALLTLTYLGSVLTMPNYNVMGVAKASLEASVRYLARSLGKDNIRVNAISAGPVRTLAASGISDFKKMLQYNASRAVLGRNITTEEVGNAAAFLCSDLSSGITGQIVYVDAGFNTTAMGNNEG